MENPFFINHGPFKISEILNILNLKKQDINFDQKVKNINDLYSAENRDISFFHSKKYKDFAKNTKATYCITTEVLKNDLSKNCIPLIVENVLVSTSIVTAKFYPNSINDDFDETSENIEQTQYKDKVKYGKNVLIGTNVRLGKNCFIGHNSIIEKNVVIGNNCNIGSNTIIRNSLIKDNVKILDNCVIGKHGFGFFPDKKKKFKIPSYRHSHSRG